MHPWRIKIPRLVSLIANSMNILVYLLCSLWWLFQLIFKLFSHEASDIWVCRCVICCTEYEDEDMLIRLPCQHWYHSDCVAKWLKLNKVLIFCCHKHYHYCYYCLILGGSWMWIKWKWDFSLGGETKENLNLVNGEPVYTWLVSTRKKTQGGENIHWLKLGTCALSTFSWGSLSQTIEENSKLSPFLHRKCNETGWRSICIANAFSTQMLFPPVISPHPNRSLLLL